MPRKTEYLQGAAKNAMTDLAYIRSMQAVMQVLQNSMYHMGREYRAEFDAAFLALRGILRRHHDGAVDRVLRHAILLEDGALKREAVAMCLTRLARDNVMLMQYLEPFGNHPGSWSTTAEAAYRTEIRAALMELTDVDPATCEEWGLLVDSDSSKELPE